MSIKYLIYPVIGGYIGSSVYIITRDIVNFIFEKKSYYCIHGLPLKAHDNIGLYIGGFIGLNKSFQ